MKLKDFAQICYGKNQRKVEVEHSEIPILGTGGIIGYASKPLYTNESVLIGRKGTLGKPFYIDRPFWTIDTLFYTKINKSLIIPRYFYYAMCSLGLERFAEGAAVPSLTTKTLNEIEIPVPTMNKQQHIVDTIGTIDDLIENREVLNKKLKQFSTDLYESYQLLDSSKTQLSIKECCKIKTGKLNADACEVNGRYPFFTCSREQSLINSYAFDTQAIIIAGNGDINCKFYKGKFNAYQRTYVLEPQSYFFLFLKQCEASINKLKKISQGSVIKFITKPMLEKIKIQLNDYALSANKNIEKVYLEMLNNSFEISKLKEIKALLLKKYF